MKKILFFTHSLVGGGAEKTIINLSEYINKNYTDVESHIAVVYDDPKVRSRLKNVHVLPYRTSKTMHTIRKIPIILKQVKALKNLKRELGIDTCISFLPGSDFLNVLSDTGERRIISVRNKESFFAKSYFKKLYIRFCYARCDEIVAISQRVKNDIETNFGVNSDKVITIYNPVPEVHFTNKTSERFETFCKGKKIILTAGRLTEQKGHAYLVRAFSNVYKQRNDVCLVILGTGELEEELINLVKELDLEKVVLFHGFVYNPYDYIKRSDLFVFSSIVEGLGNILIECMACGVPIVSTDCDCGPREILAPDTKFDKATSEIEIARYGVLIPVCFGTTNAKQTLSREEKIMADAILWTLTQEELLEEYKNRAKVRLEDFEISKIVSQWMNVILPGDNHEDSFTL